MAHHLGMHIDCALDETGEKLHLPFAPYLGVGVKLNTRRRVLLG